MGEDGTVQGMLKLAMHPPLSALVCWALRSVMDKDVMKRLFREKGYRRQIQGITFP
jgi:D-alanine-D-alanine ligase-like ATP-grasp enzyme